jgi:hypothetical protein
MMSGALNAMSGGWLPSELKLTQLYDVRTFFVLYGLAFALMSGVLLALNAHVLRLQLAPPLGRVDEGLEPRRLLLPDDRGHPPVP